MIADMVGGECLLQRFVHQARSAETLDGCQLFPDPAREPFVDTAEPVICSSILGGRERSIRSRLGALAMTSDDRLHQAHRRKANEAMPSRPRRVSSSLCSSSSQPSEPITARKPKLDEIPAVFLWPPMF